MPSSMNVTANEKRWIVTGITLNKVVASNLRPLVQDGLEKEYENLKRSHAVDTQAHPAYCKTWPGITGRNFKYENINGNDVYRLAGRKFALTKFDFKVKSAVDLGHLCLESHMAKFTSFNENCDGSAILSLLESVPSFAASVQAAAKTVKQNVRNEWAHCAFIDWDEIKFQDSFRAMKLLLNAAGLTAAGHDLDEWESKGMDLDLQLGEQEIVELRSLFECVTINQSENELIRIELSRLLKLESRQDALEKKVQEIIEGRLTCTKDNSAVKKFIQILKMWYTCEETHIAPLPWMEDADFTLDKMYTPLVISQVNKGKETNIDMQDVFKVDEMGKTPVNVLLEGSPGAGKTTCCRKLAYDWAEGMSGSFQEYEMVLFLKCRDVKGGCIWKAIEEQLLPEETTVEEREEIFLYIKSNQEKVLFIIDGYDEIPNAAESESIKESVTKVIRKKALPLCRTLVTSRQSKSHGIQKHFQMLLKIKGIASYEDYITSFFDDSPPVELLKHVKRNPNLCELASNAMNVALLCLVFKENSTKRIQWKELSLPELYCEIVFCITKRYCKKMNLEVDDYNLMEQFGQQHLSLGRFAFDNLIKNQITFSENLSEELESLGFLVKEKPFKVLRQVEGGVYAFAHKSIQDYFAALYVADRLRKGVGDDALRLSKFEVFEAINRYDLASMIGSDHVSDVSKYLANMSSSCANDLPQPVLILICECLSECSHLPDFRQTLEDVYHHIPAKVDFRVPMDCRKKALSGLCCLMSYKNTENVAFESENQVSEDMPGQCETRRTIPFNELTLSNLQCYDLDHECGEALANNTTTVSLRLLFNDRLGEEDHRSVCKVLRQNTSLQAFEVQGMCIDDESVCSIMDSLSDNSTIKEFAISNHDIHVGIDYPHIKAIHFGNAFFLCINFLVVLNVLTSYLLLFHIIIYIIYTIAQLFFEGSFDYFITLQTVYQYSWQRAIFNTCLFSYLVFVILILILILIDMIVSLFAFYVLIITGNAGIISKLFIKFTTIHRGVFGARVVEVIARVLKKKTQIKNLHLVSNKIGTNLACALQDVLAKRKTFEKLELQGNIGDWDAKRIAKGLAENNKLKSFTLSTSTYTGGILPTYHLKRTVLPIFTNADMVLSCPGACAVVEALTRNHAIAHLDLSNNAIGKKGAKAIGQMLADHTILKTLRIGNNLLGEAGTVYIADGLAKNTGLEELDISFNGAGDKGICAIASAVVKHNTLKVLKITLNDISDVGAKVLVDACFKSKVLPELYSEDHPVFRRYEMFHCSKSLEDTMIPHEFVKTFESLSGFEDMIAVLSSGIYLSAATVAARVRSDVINQGWLSAWQKWHYRNDIKKNFGPDVVSR